MPLICFNNLNWKLILFSPSIKIFYFYSNRFSFYILSECTAHLLVVPRCTIEKITRFRHVSRKCFEKCVFVSVSGVRPVREREDVFVSGEQLQSSVLRVRKRHSCWPFNQRNCRSIKFEPVPILSNDNALCALVFHEIEKFLSFRAETPNSIMESLHRENSNVCSL